MMDSLKTRAQLECNGRSYEIYSLRAAESRLGDLSRLPFSLRILLENLLRHEDGKKVTADDIRALAGWLVTKTAGHEIAFQPGRVLMQDFTGVPAIVDLATMREAMVKLGGDPSRINPLKPVDLVIDHSVMVDHYGTSKAFEKNVSLEMERNRERYEFLKWGQNAFDNFRVVPPGTGICHQVNLEHLATVVWAKRRGKTWQAFPDTLVGTDSHTTMVNGLGVLGWGVGGIEAEAAMLGQPLSMLIPEVVGFKLKGRLKEHATATDLVLTVTEMLRQHGVVGKFVEFFGSGLTELTVPNRATIANMAPEYGATCGFFPVDAATVNYLRFTGRDESTAQLVEAYCRQQGLWHDENVPDPVFTTTLELDLSKVESSLAGPKRPQDRVLLSKAAKDFKYQLGEVYGRSGEDELYAEVAGEDFMLSHGDVVIAAITSCTNTSNPSVMLAAGLLARGAVRRGLKVKPWVKTSLAPGSQVVSDYLAKAGLQDDLDALGFNLVGYGCTTCIGNSGPLTESVAQAIQEKNLVVASVLSGNRNFEGRISPDVKANYLASPPLVVAYALAGSMKVDLVKDPLGKDKFGKPIFLKDIWPTNTDVNDMISKIITSDMFRVRYADVFKGDATWRTMPVAQGQTFSWNPKSTYVRNPPYFDTITKKPQAVQGITNAHILALLGDSITTDHISPAGSIKQDSPAGKYLMENGVELKDFNSYGSRRGNHEVMMRGTFANVRLKNIMVEGREGGFTKHYPSGDILSIYDAAVRYKAKNTPLVIFAGKEYGTGSSRDWAAKGTLLLGVKAVIAESFERIHRSNLIGMGVLPLEFKAGESWQAFKLAGDETVTLSGHEAGLKPKTLLKLHIKNSQGEIREAEIVVRIDTETESAYYAQGGILPYVLRFLA